MTHGVLRRLLVLSLSLACAAARADTVVYVLRQTEGALRVDPVTIKDNSEVKWTVGTDGFIDVVLPPGPGGSAGIVQAAGRPETVVSLRQGTLSVVTTAAGRRFERPVPTRDQLKSLDIHLSARAQSGHSLACFIRSYERIEPDPVGVIEDPFGSAVPLSPGDVVIYTSTYEPPVRAAAPLKGEAPVRYVGGHHLCAATLGAVSGNVLLDLAAGTSIVAESALTPGTGIEPALAHEYSAEGVKRLAAEIGGATDSAAPLGIARIPSLTIGGLTIKDAEVMVVKELPPVATGIIGIVGLDLLSRGGVVSLPYPPEGQTAPLRLGIPETGAVAAKLPIALLGPRAYCRARVNGSDVCMIVDSGAPMTILDERAGAAATPANEPARSVRGIGSARTSLAPATVKSLTLGTLEIPDARVEVGSLPLFARFKGATPTGVLGNATLSRFSRVEIDFERAEMRLFK